MQPAKAAAHKTHTHLTYTHTHTALVNTTGGNSEFLSHTPAHTLTQAGPVYTTCEDSQPYLDLTSGQGEITDQTAAY